MFKNFFNRKKKGKKHTQSSPKSSRDLFEELFPLSEENQHTIEVSIRSILEQMYGREGAEELLSYSRSHEQVEQNVDELMFDCLGWEKIDRPESKNYFQNSFGDYFTISIATPSGKLERNQSELAVYREWIRDVFAQQNGGLLYCEEFVTPSGVDGFESIGKMPSQEDLGMDYTYFINASHYQSQQLYQIIVRMHEMTPTGLRDNLMMHPIADISGLGIEELMEVFRQDPYDKTYQGGNPMNISEREEFDTLFPFHPLSMIRREIRPRLLQSLRFKS